MLKLIVFALFVAGASAFWASCNIPGVLDPDRIESPSCSGDRCTVQRGEILIADVFLTPNKAHEHLMVTVTAFIFGVGVNVGIYNLFVNF